MPIPPDPARYRHEARSDRGRASRSQVNGIRAVPQSLPRQATAHALHVTSATASATHAKWHGGVLPRVYVKPVCILLRTAGSGAGSPYAHDAIRPLGGGSQSGGEMRRCVLCGRWARLAFPRAREKKALVVVVAQLAKIERPVNRTPGGASGCSESPDPSQERSRW